MYELIQVGENTYYVESPAKVGVYHMGEGRVCLIDSGSDKDAARKILKILAEQNWTLETIVCTHHHADHIGGNHLLQERTGCRILGAGLDRVFMEAPVLEPISLFAGLPPKALRGKAMMAQPSRVEELTEDALPAGLRMLRVDGHSPAMAAIHTPDDVWFLADALTSVEILEKYHVSFLYDLEAYFATLDTVESLSGALFIPAHAAPCTQIAPLAQANRNKARELLALVQELCSGGIELEALLAQVFDHYGLTLSFAQYALSGSTLRSYLSYLLDHGQVETEIRNNHLIWKNKA